MYALSFAGPGQHGAVVTAGSYRLMIAPTDSICTPRFHKFYRVSLFQI